jgi:hypothetical protein
MKTYQQIYEELQTETNGTYTTLEVLRIFRDEGGNWVGSANQLMQLSALSLELTGIRVGECSGCKITAIRNMLRWLENHEQTILNQLTLEKYGKPRKTK